PVPHAQGELERNFPPSVPAAARPPRVLHRSDVREDHRSARRERAQEVRAWPRDLGHDGPSTLAPPPPAPGPRAAVVGPTLALVSSACGPPYVPKRPASRGDALVEEETG